MKTLDTTATVTADGQLIVQVPPDIAPGDHRIVVVIDENLSPPVSPTPKPPLKLNVFRWEGWSHDDTFRREDLYGDDGR